MPFLWLSLQCCCLRRMQCLLSTKCPLNAALLSCPGSCRLGSIGSAGVAGLTPCPSSCLLSHHCAGLSAEDLLLAPALVRQSIWGCHHAVLKCVGYKPAASGSWTTLTWTESLPPHSVSALAGLAGLMKLGSTCSSEQHNVPYAPLPEGGVEMLLGTDAACSRWVAGHTPVMFRV